MTLTEPTRRERKKEETRRRIFTAAISLFREKGFEQTTVDEITEKADVGRGTFFNYFPRKESVLAFLSEERLEVAEENGQVLLAEARPVRDKLIEVYAFAASAYTEDRELSRYVFNEWMQRAFAPTEEVGCRWEKLLLKIIEQGQGNGELRSDVAADRMESVLSSVYMSTLYFWLCCPLGMPEGSDFALVDEVKARIGLVIDGLGARSEVKS